MDSAEHRAWLASQPLSIRFVRGFESARKGWMPFFGEIGLLSVRTGKDGLFFSQAAALRAGEEFRGQYDVHTGDRRGSED
ncbi:MAG: hypothetical protein HQM04_06625 [Magnetococcales bacterium]|nr:hypothetical protein [Magnetococcales bacterium]MBF0114701.1 hypothetical protein [Magnetococcales bacterium]